MDARRVLVAVIVAVYCCLTSACHNDKDRDLKRETLTPQAANSLHQDHDHDGDDERRRRQIGPTTITFDLDPNNKSLCSASVQWPEYNVKAESAPNLKGAAAGTTFTVTFLHGTPFLDANNKRLSKIIIKDNSATPKYTFDATAADKCPTTGCYYAYDLAISKKSCVGDTPPSNTFGFHIKGGP